MMATQTRRSTIYFDRDLYKALRLKAVETSKSMSAIVNAAVKKAIAEDAEDILFFDERADEPLIGYDEMVKRLKRDGRI